MSNITFAIPPFPSQDLAKLVLGYLAEEQLMTAYDEFLQASPYLDALQNEYDRIFMTSLKNILAEYRAVKIYVETCKPFVLRRKLFQCTNLLEIVKFLVNNIDINKLHSQDGNMEKVGSNRHIFSSSKSYSCDVFLSPRLPNCTYRSNQSTSQIETTSLEGSVETTSLADLPGNISYKKKIVKEAESKNNTFTSITSSDQTIDGRAKSVTFSANMSSMMRGSDTTDNVISSITEKKCATNLNLVDHTIDLRENVRGATDINLVNVKRNVTESQQRETNTASDLQILGTDNIQNIATGDSSNSKVIVPDSSTSENVIQSSTTEVDKITNSANASKGTVRPPPLLIKIGNEHKHMNLQPNALHTLPRFAPKSKVEEEVSPKITILSDIKVDKDAKIPPILRSSSSSLVPMQTLYINGTQAYNNPHPVDQRFTKDEIMAMPTIILVPASDKNKKIVPTVTQNNLLNIESNIVSCSTAQTLEPLVIDVSSNDDTCSKIHNTDDIAKNPTSDNMLIKTVDVMPLNHASLPKDNTLTGIKTSTPHVLPPTRKSSSTPRRTSHVRVLDFTTPRRILHETLTEQEVNQVPSSDEPLPQDSTSQAIIKNSEDSINIVDNVINADTSNDTHSVAKKEKKTNIKLYNWDAELRSLAYLGNGSIEKTAPSRKSKSKKSKKRESVTNKSTPDQHNNSEEVKAKKLNDSKKVTPKIKSTKSGKKSVEADTNDIEKQESTTSIVKPTINIISRKKWAEPVETEKSQIKSSTVDGTIDTPELEKMSLQNEIGIKLNISDLLETPYKQALYDIQMETPKFLGPDILDEPLSDIKIMNIPTPRFLNTPKLPQNTPSSYSSRPTDYSSGGSYYKPDDQDYVLVNDIIADDLPLSEASKLKKESKPTENQNANAEKVCEGKLRPVRKCTKNVSYKYRKVKDIEESLEKSSSYSESSLNKPDKKIDKPKIAKISSDKDDVVGKQKESKKKGKKHKSPMKREAPKTFMKIKPRRTTPVKEVLGKGRKKNRDNSQVVYIKPQSKKVVDKDRHVCFSTVVIPVPTKSRRKSSTPRKLHCSKRFNSESSPEEKNQKSPQHTNINAICIQDSDSEQQCLQWSDDGSQELKLKTTEEKLQLANESDDINKIKDYINKTVPSGTAARNESEGTLQVDLIKRGFDIETARMIERDLLEPTSNNLTKQDPTAQAVLQSLPSPIVHETDNESKSKILDKSVELDCSTSNNLQIVQDDDDNDLDFSVQECNEDSKNYFVYSYDEANFTPSDQIKLKETFSMEICIENDVTIRLRATPFNTGFEHDSKNEDSELCDKSNNEKPTSPPNDNLFTPRKAQCYQLFDSTLASLDTPLKPDSPEAKEFETVMGIVLEVEKLETDIKLKPESDIKLKPETDIKFKAETKKRKRNQSVTSDESNGSKKVKPDTSYLLNSAGIQNIDIESVLSKLHGP